MGSRQDRAFPEDLTRALLAVLDGDHDEAESILRALVEADTTRIGAMLALGRLYRFRGEVGRAIRVHQNLLLRSDTDKASRVAALRGVAEDFKQGGFLQRAIAAFEEFRVERPRDTSAIRALTDLYAKLRDFPRALAMRKRLGRGEAIGIPSEAELLVSWAEAQIKRGEQKEAHRLLRRALRRDPQHAAAWERLGDLERDSGRERKAEKAFQQALEWDPSRARSVYPKLSALFAARQRTADYEKFLEAKLDSNPADLDSQIALCRSLEARGELEQAITGVERLLGQRSDHLEALALRTRWLMKKRADPDSVRAAFEATYEGLTKHHVFQRRERLQ